MMLMCGAAIPSLAMADPSKDIIARGAYLANAGDCTSCHSRSGQPAFSGGDDVRSPFGTIAPPNITADKQYGIGTWSDDDFYRALHDGVRKDGAYLYPAMPYQWYTRITRDDALAIKAYLFSLPPAHIPDRANHLVFPFNVRQGIAGWNALYFKPGTFQEDASKSPQWNRGAYLVKGLGHCGDCHTPKNAAQAPIESERYAGGEIMHWYAPNITSDKKQGIGGWSENDLFTFLKKGSAAGHGVVIGKMREVHKTLEKFTDADLHDIAMYLKTIPPKTSYSKPAVQSQADYASGADVYTTNCSACHQPNGKGLAGAVPPLAGNGAVTSKGPENVIRAVAGGLPAEGSYAAMPGFATILTTQQIADVANYVRTTWGNGAPANATLEMVNDLVPRTTSMMAGTHWCAKPSDSPVGRLVSNATSGVPDILGQINENNELPEVDKLVEDVRRKAPHAQSADIVNQLTAAYCPYVFNNKSVPANRRGPALDQFAELVYSQMHVTQ
jgi:mono/diheme cytochrome c family protein